MSGSEGYSYNRFDSFEKALLEAKKCEKCGESPCECKDGKKSKSKKTAGARPDYLDLDKDGDKEEDMADAADSAEGGGMSEETVMEAGPAMAAAMLSGMAKLKGRNPSAKGGKGSDKSDADCGCDSKEDVKEGIDFKGAKRIDAAREAEQKKKDEKNPSGKDRRLALRKFRPGASAEERAEGGRDSMREKGTSPKKDGKKMFEEIEAAGLFTAEELEHISEALLGKN